LGPRQLVGQEGEGIAELQNRVLINAFEVSSTSEGSFSSEVSFSSDGSFSSEDTAISEDSFGSESSAISENSPAQLARLPMGFSCLDMPMLVFVSFNLAASR
jgi:hypothetical protein